MRYVLDASVGIKWVMNEVDSAEARRLRDDFRNQIHELVAPASFPWKPPTPLRRPSGGES